MTGGSQNYEGNIGSDEEDTRRTTDTAEGEGLVQGRRDARLRPSKSLQGCWLFGHPELSPFPSVFAVPDDKRDCSGIINLSCIRCPIPDAFATPLHVSTPSIVSSGLFPNIRQ